MGIITVSIDDKVEEKFREVVEKNGSKKGDLGRAITEAMKKWADEKEQKDIAERQKKMSEKGLYKLPKGWKFDRNEIYDRN